MLGLCLVAVFAVAAVAATSAMALPEWGQCYAKAGGKYANSNCTVKAKKGAGEFEWRKGASVEPSQRKFSGAGGLGILAGEYKICEPHASRRTHCENEGEEVEYFGEPLNVECESEFNHGETSGAKGVANIAVIFRGCKLLGSVPCSNTSNEGEIQTSTLKGELGYINKSTKDVGVLLEPTIKHGLFADFTCIGGAIGTAVGVGNKTEGAAYSPESTGGYDGIISPVTPVNEMSTEFTQVYTINGSEENVPNSFEGKHIELLESYLYNTGEPGVSTKWSRAGESITNVNKQLSGEPVEIKA
jgi:hypothetical protein